MTRTLCALLFFWTVVVDVLVTALTVSELGWYGAPAFLIWPGGLFAAYVYGCSVGLRTGGARAYERGMDDGIARMLV